VIYHGKSACDALEAAEKIELTPAERRIVMLEGYATEQYRCTAGILTNGCGQTGEWIARPFRDSFMHHVERAKARFNDWRTYPEYLKTELIQAEYRGDLGQSPKAISFIRAGLWEAAANEFLNSAEYRNPATPKQIKRRMLAVHYALRLRAQQ